MLLVYTGDGKGKTTASLDVTLRAILEMADLVSTVAATKHHYEAQDVTAMKGLEF